MSSTGILLLVLWLAAVPGLTPLLMRSYHRAIRERLTCTSGVVTGYEDKSHADDSGGVVEVYRPTVRFVTASGEPVHATSKVWPRNHPPEVGEVVSVLYRRDRHPAEWFFVGDRASYDERTRRSRRGVVAGGFLVLLAPLTMWLLSR